MSFQKLISIQKINDDDIEQAVFRALEAIHAESLILREGMRILLKPNLLSAKPPERAVTTHPAVVRAVIHWIKQFNPSKIYVADSSGGRARVSLKATIHSLKVSGIQSVCEEEGVECLPLEKTKREIYPVPNPLILNEILSTNLLKEVDLLINIPKIKTHSLTFLTCCIKNMFGIILLANKAKIHALFPRIDEFSSALVDIYSVSPPQLTLIDGYLCQEGNGPSAGNVVKLDLILAGYDPVALDTLVCKIIGLDPDRVLYLAKAEAKGLGSMALDEFKIIGESVNSVQRSFKIPGRKNLSLPFPLPKFLTNYASRTLFRPTIHFNKLRCKLCGTCWESCPVGAISPPKETKTGNNVPIWNSSKCITCYCCAELCPCEAVDFKVNILKNIFLSWFGGGILCIIEIIIVVIICL